MIKTVLTLAFAGATGAAGYLGGSIYPAPPQWTTAIGAEADAWKSRLDIEGMDLASLQDLLSREKFDQLSSEIGSLAVAAGEAIEIERDNSTREEQLDNLALSEADVAIPPAQPVVPATTPAPGSAPRLAPEQVFEATLLQCPRMTVENSPGVDAQGRVTGFKPVVDIQGVRVATGPTRDGCLSSGYGQRNSRLHKGVDYHNETGGPVLAGGDGVIIEMKYRDDYGNMLLIDHGKGVYTRYAHLASFGPGLAPGVTVRAGEQIGLMGNTGAYRVPVHLHYEVLLGDYKNAKASFGLKPADPFDYPAAT
jgi:murein DD-endopeptidase MepM/ murein hydrolase activator NlpD